MAEKSDGKVPFFTQATLNRKRRHAALTESVSTAENINTLHPLPIEGSAFYGPDPLTIGEAPAKDS
jgi:hypothetical protein